SVLGLGHSECWCALLLPAVFCVGAEESLPGTGCGQAGWAAVPDPTPAATDAARIQIFDLTVLRSCYLIVIGRATTLQPVLTEKSVCKAPHGIGPPPKTPLPE